MTFSLENGPVKCLLNKYARELISYLCRFTLHATVMVTACSSGSHHCFPPLSLSVSLPLPPLSISLPEKGTQARVPTFQVWIRYGTGAEKAAKPGVQLDHAMKNAGKKADIVPRNLALWFLASPAA